VTPIARELLAPSLDGKSHAPNLLRLTEGQDRTVYYFQLFPNLLISLHPDYVMTHRPTPLAPDRTAVECQWLFSSFRHQDCAVNSPRSWVR